MGQVNKAGQSTLEKIRSSPFYKILQFIIVFTVFYFIIRLLWQNWNEIAEYSWKIDFYLLSLAIVFRIFKMGLLGYCWHYILLQYNSSISYPKSLRIYTSSQLTRYIPGKIWHFVSRTVMTQKENISAIVVSASLILELLFIVLTGIVIFLFSLTLWREVISGLWVFMLIALIPILVILIYPPFFNYFLVFGTFFLFLLSVALKLVGRKSPNLYMSIKANVIIFTLFILTWLLGGISTYFLFASVYSLDITQLPAIVGIVSLSWVVGFVSFIAPSGLGFREATMTFLLAFIVPAPIAALLAIVARLFATIIEVVFAGVVWLIDLIK